jgi:4'-phosphopantetheinyl transferase
MKNYFVTQRAGNVPIESSWLSPDEVARAAQFRFQKRRSDWLLGRWTAKTAVQRYLLRSGFHLEPARIEIVTAPDGAPEARLPDGAPPVSISLSHSAGTGLAAVGEGSLRLGCDLERIEPRSPEFLPDYFTAQERAFADAGADGERALRYTLIWSAKESALKWLREGLRLDTRSVEVRIGDLRAGWSPFSAHFGQELSGWWRLDGDFIETITGLDLDPPAAL